MQALLGLFSLRKRERRDGKTGFKRNLLTSAAACMWASALLAVFMGYNVSSGATFPSRDLAACSGEGTVKACHQEPRPPVIYQGGMFCGGQDESHFPEPYVRWLRLAILRIKMLFHLKATSGFFRDLSSMSP